MVRMPLSIIELRMLVRANMPERELLRALADCLGERRQELGAEERERFTALLAALLDDTAVPGRQGFAEWLAVRPLAPRDTVLRLAEDVTAVAAPLLAGSAVLDDDDLARLAERVSTDHLLAIARRKTLSSRITDILISRGDAKVRDTVAGNAAARLSAVGAATLMQGGMQIDEVELRERVTVTPRPCPARPLDELADLIEQGILRLGEAVIELADADRVHDLAVLICGDSNSPNFIREISATDELPLMVLCRACGLDIEAFSAVLRLRRRRRPFAAGDIGRLLRSYQALPNPLIAEAPTRDKRAG
jgi:hypothetical protein